MWIIPSRSRPHNLARLIAACRTTDMATPALILVDDDDPLAASYRAIDPPASWSVAVGKRAKLSALYNAAFAAHPDLAWYGFLADDILPETKRWDRILVETAGSDGLAYGDDGVNGAGHAAHFALGGDLVRAVGFLSLPGLERLFIDTAWCDIARARGVLRYLPAVKLTHLHFSNRRALLDATYRKPRRAADRAIYDAWRNNQKDSR